MAIVRSSFIASVLFAFSVALALISWWVPLHFYPWGSFYNESSAVLAVIVAGFAILLLTPRSSDGRSGYAVPLHATAFLAVCAFIPLLQFLIGPLFYFGDAVVHSGYVVVCALALFVGTVLRRRFGADFVVVFASLLVLGAVVSVVVASRQWLGIEGVGLWLLDLPPGGRPYANLAQTNNFALLCILGLAALVYLREAGQIRTVLVFAVALTLLAGIAMTRSRMTFFVMVALALWLYRSSRLLRMKTSSTEAIAGFALYAILWLAWPLLSESLLLPAESALDRIGSSAADIRLLFWRQLADAVVGAGWFGWGWGQVSVAQVSVALDYPRTLYTEYSHNLLLDLLVWNGIPIGALAISGIGWWVLRGLARVRTAEGWLGMAVVLAVGVHSIFEFPFAYAYFLMPLGAAVGIVEAERGEHEGRTLSVSRTALFAMVSTCLAAFVLIFHEYTSVESDYRQMRMESAGLAMPTLHDDRSGQVLLTHLAELTRLARMEVSEDMSGAMLERMRKAAHRFPFPPALYRYALALGLNHRAEDAARELKLLRQLHTPERYQEAVDGWKVLSAVHPQLRLVALPEPSQ